MSTGARLGLLDVAPSDKTTLEMLVESGTECVSMLANHDGWPSIVASGAIADLDGVVVSTPNALRVDQAVDVVERGLAVFCRRPLGVTAHDARRAVDAAR